MNKLQNIWNIKILTLFPEFFPGPLSHSIAGKALSNKIWELEAYDLRKYTKDKHQTVDDKPFGGGTGMVINPVVIGDAINEIKSHKPVEKIIYLSPRGKLFNQRKAEELISQNNILFLCGRYEGIDQRAIEKYEMEEISIGDFILSGGEIAALTIIDSCVRLLPNVIKNHTALVEESFSSQSQYENLLEYPHYTRPTTWENMDVPEILLSGHHKKIDDWRLSEAEKITKTRRKDLWDEYIKNKIEK